MSKRAGPWHSTRKGSPPKIASIWSYSDGVNLHFSRLVAELARIQSVIDSCLNSGLSELWRVQLQHRQRVLAVLQRKRHRLALPLRFEHGHDHFDRRPRGVDAAQRLTVFLNGGNQVFHRGDISS